MTVAPIIVAGLPRSGAGAIMTMLSAAGLHPMGDMDIHSGHTKSSIGVWHRKQFSNSVYRFVAPHQRDLPPGVPFRVIMVTRNHKQQAISQRETARKIAPKHAPTVRRLQADIARQEPKVIARLRGYTYLHATFEHLINNPLHQASLIRDFLELPAETIQAMAAVIRERDSRHASGNRLWPPKVA